MFAFINGAQWLPAAWPLSASPSSLHGGVETQLWLLASDRSFLQQQAEDSSSLFQRYEGAHRSKRTTTVNMQMNPYMDKKLRLH